MKTDKISFGTRPFVGDINSSKLAYYNIRLTNGILDAFEQLAKNGLNDQLVLTIGRKPKAKKITTNAIELDYWKDENNIVNSFTLSPSSLAKKSAKKISKIIIETYEKLKQSKKKDVYGLNRHTIQISNESIFKEHAEKINKLRNKFGSDDITYA